MAKTMDGISKTDKEAIPPVSTPMEAPKTEDAAVPAAEKVTIIAEPEKAVEIKAEAAKEAPATENPAAATMTAPEVKEGTVPAPELAVETTTPSAVTPPDSFDSLFPEPTVVISSPPSWIWWVLLVIGSLGLGFLTYELASGQLSHYFVRADTAKSVAITNTVAPTATPSAAATATPTPAASDTPTPAATATPSPSLSDVTTRVLNGTTLAGAAGKMKTNLTAAGYTVRTVGNAANQTYARTTVYYQTGHLGDAQAVATAIGTSPTLTESTSLSKPDVILVVVGAK